MRKGILLAALGAHLALTACDLGPIGRAKEAMRERMLDPDAAEFRDMQMCPEGKDRVMGQVNGKNAFGAYTGFKHFLYVDGRARLVEDRDFVAAIGDCYGSEAMKDAERTMRELAAEPMVSK